MPTIVGSGNDRVGCFICIYIIYRLTVEEIMAILEAYNDLLNAGIILQPPENATVSGEDSNPEDGECGISHLTGNQLRRGCRTPNA